MHISPRTVQFLRSLGHEALRVNEVLPSAATDQEVIDFARVDRRVILTQDLDFSAKIALSGTRAPSLISLRVSSSQIEHVNSVLERVLPTLEEVVIDGVIATVENQRVRQRKLPIG